MSVFVSSQPMSGQCESGWACSKKDKGNEKCVIQTIKTATIPQQYTPGVCTHAKRGSLVLTTTPTLT